jgi:RNA polymerase-interacting CarD/CdnL/TRCF family regulator
VKGPPARHEEPKEQLPAVEGIIVDAGELEPGDRVVYPNQGVCRITGVEAKEIAGHKLELVRMEREEDGAAVLVPKGKVPAIGLRKVASGDQIDGVFHYLAAQYDDPELDWKVRHRDNADRLIAGGVLGVAEVVKGLHALSRIRPLPAKEREQYDNARHLLVHEVAVSLGVPPALAEDYVDYALMPPAGVTFKLKPPPKPVELPSRPRRRVARSDDDLELDDLGLDLELPEVPGAGGEPAEAMGGDDATPIPGVPSPDDLALPDAGSEAEAPEDAMEEAEGEPVADEGAGDDEEPPPARKPHKPEPARAARAAAEAKPAKKKAASRKPARPEKAKPEARKPEKKRAAPPKPARKAATRGGKKK